MTHDGLKAFRRLTSRFDNVDSLTTTSVCVHGYIYAPNVIHQAIARALDSPFSIRK